jgi:4-carboxymuconolactone decarboxylase
VSAEAVEAIAEGNDPPLRHDEAIVHSVACQLVETGHVDAETYDAARQLLGDRGIVELVTLCGYYTLVSFTLNAFEVPLPPGERTTWED